MSSSRLQGRRSPLASPAVRSWLLQLYPQEWRERYGNEFEILLEECLHSPLDVIDICLGALDAHLQYPYDMNWRSINMVNKLRTSILIVFAAYIAFVVGGLSLYGLADDSPMAALMKTNLPLLAAWTGIELASVISLLAVVIGGVPLAYMIVRGALSPSHKNLRYLLVPLMAFLALVFYGAFMAVIAFGAVRVSGVAPAVSPQNFPIGNRLLIAGLMVVFVDGAVASTIAVWHAASNTADEPGTLQVLGRNLPLRPYSFALIPAVITALGMLCMLIGTIVWGTLAYHALPDVFSANWGLLQTNTMASLGVTVAIMAIATLVAFLGLARGFSARRSG